MHHDGAKVVIIVSLDTGTSIAIEKKLAAKQMESRSTTTARSSAARRRSTSRSTARSASSRAQGVIAGLKANGDVRQKPVIAELGAARPTRTRIWFKSGNDDVLNPLFKKKVRRARISSCPAGTTRRQTIFEQMLVQTNNKIQGVVAANDGIAERSSSR